MVFVTRTVRPTQIADDVFERFLNDKYANGKRFFHDLDRLKEQAGVKSRYDGESGNMSDDEEQNRFTTTVTHSQPPMSSLKKTRHTSQAADFAKDEEDDAAAVPKRSKKLEMSREAARQMRVEESKVCGALGGTMPSKRDDPNAQMQKLKYQVSRQKRAMNQREERRPSLCFAVPDCSLSLTARCAGFSKAARVRGGAQRRADDHGDDPRRHGVSHDGRTRVAVRPRGGARHSDRARHRPGPGAGPVAAAGRAAPIHRDPAQDGTERRRRAAVCSAQVNTAAHSLLSSFRTKNFCLMPQKCDGIVFDFVALACGQSCTATGQYNDDRRIGTEPRSQKRRRRLRSRVHLNLTSTDVDPTRKGG